MNQSETWANISGIQDCFVSSSGKFKKVDSNGIFKELKIYNYGGYSTIYIHTHGSLYAHRVVAIAHIENPENKPYVNHINLNKSDNRVINLEWVTAKENSRHYVDIKIKIPTKKIKLIEDNNKRVNHAYPRNLWEKLTRLANLKGAKLTGYVNSILWRHVESEEKKK